MARSSTPVYVKVRAMRIGDAKSVATLSGQLGYPVSQVQMKRRIAIVRNRRMQKLFVAEIDGNVEGWVEVFRPLSVLNWGKGEVGALVVERTKRGSGIGRLLLERARTWSMKQGCQFIYLRSNVKRKDAHRFYQKAGYRIHKTQHVFQLLLHGK